jgi:hypothetical protein
MRQVIEIGDYCTFRDKGTTREGRVVGIEQVDRGDMLGRSPGRWFKVRIAGTLFEDIEVHENALGSVLDVVA